jgi:hypothetical protein
MPTHESSPSSSSSSVVAELRQSTSNSLTVHIRWWVVDVETDEETSVAEHRASMREWVDCWTKARADGVDGHRRLGRSMSMSRPYIAGHTTSRSTRAIHGRPLTTARHVKTPASNG